MTYNVKTGVALVANLVDVLARLSNDDAGIASNNESSHGDLSGLGLRRVADATSASGSLVAVEDSTVRNRTVVGFDVTTGGGVGGDAGAKVDGILLVDDGLCRSVRSHLVNFAARGRRGIDRLSGFVGFYVWTLSFGFGRTGCVSLTLCDF